MKKIIVIMTLCLSIAMADSVLLVKKGWQLIGVSTPIEEMSQFEEKNVEQVWHFDASTQSWLAYAPNATIQEKMTAQHIEKLNTLEPWHGFWVKSVQDWNLTLANSTPEDIDNNHASDLIILKKGWNLISLPVDMVVSPKIFKEDIVWKYNSDNAWEFFDENQSEADFPKLAHIGNSDGLWVKASEDHNISVVDDAENLHNFASQEEMESYIKEMLMLNDRPYYGIYRMVDFAVPVLNGSEMVVDSAVPSTTEATNTSNTNVQEHGVDEADVLKHDGTHIFYLKSATEIGITTFEALSQNNKNSLASIALENNCTISEMYLVNQRLVVLSNNYQSSTSHVVVDIFDVSNMEAVTKLATYQLDGFMVTSRVIDDNLFLVSTFTPTVDVDYPLLNEGANNIYMRYDYEHPTVTIKDLMPEIEGTDLSRQALIHPSTLYASSKEKQSSVSMTTISKISIANARYEKSNSFLGYSSVQYASQKAFYLVSNEYPWFYDFNNYKERSTIYKFGLDDALAYKGLGSVYGSPINQFALSEYNDILRLATTEGFSWGSAGTTNSLYTLKEESGYLNVEGVLSGLGKTGESIRSVRFMGDKAYVVTFRQTDPFYTLDVSDPKAPQKIGELQVNGYSGYLHPIGENQILGIGRDANADGQIEGIKLELFDISDFAHPTSLDTMLVGTQQSYSELEYNHKALAFRSSDNLFAFPYSNNYYPSTDHLLGVYQIDNNQIVGYKASQQNITTGDNTQERGLIFDINNSTYIAYFANGTIETKTLDELKGN